MGLKNYTWDKIFSLLIVPSLLETIKMLLISGILATLIGFLIGVVLVGTRKVTLSARSPVRSESGPKGIISVRCGGLYWMTLSRWTRPCWCSTRRTS